MALNLTTGAGQTPLDADEAAQLIAIHITTQGQLDEWEAANILQAVRWEARARIDDVLREEFCRELHRRMFGRTWRWAGCFRTSDKNIGCDWRQVPTRLRQLLDNVRYWLGAGTFPVDEIAVRLHHQLVWIHPFPNGNGRHARLMTDVMRRRSGLSAFTWGAGGDLVTRGDVRHRYLSALRAADLGDVEPLAEFVRS